MSTIFRPAFYFGSAKKSPKTALSKALLRHSTKRRWTIKNVIKRNLRNQPLYRTSFMNYNIFPEYNMQTLKTSATTHIESCHEMLHGFFGVATCRKILQKKRFLHFVSVYVNFL